MITDYFTSDILVERKTTVDNGMGGKATTFNMHLQFKGLVDYLSGQKIDIARQYADKATHILICEVGKDITIFDRVIYDTNYYRVLHVDSPFDRHMEILLEYVGVDNNV